MRYYVAVEGSLGAKAVYEAWIAHINPNLRHLDYPSQKENDSFYVLASGGYPEYWNSIADICGDIVDYEYTDLVIAVDSEEQTYQQKKEEALSFISTVDIACNKHIIIQNFCFESWALGNRKIFSTTINDRILQSYVRHYNVKLNDPELLTTFIPHTTRAQHAFNYLRKLINEKNKRMTYAKNNTLFLQNDKYLTQLISRRRDTAHIASFQDFIQVFSPA